MLQEAVDALIDNGRREVCNGPATVLEVFERYAQGKQAFARTSWVEG